MAWSAVFCAYTAAMIRHAGLPAPVRLWMALPHALNDYGVFVNIFLDADDDHDM